MTIVPTTVSGSFRADAVALFREMERIIQIADPHIQVEAMAALAHAMWQGQARFCFVSPVPGEETDNQRGF